VSLDIWLTVIPDEPAAVTVFDANYTHNVTPMWHKAGIYDALYLSDGQTAADVLPALRAGLADMQAKHDEYTDLDASNGWGTYATAFPWLEKLVAAFEANPKGRIHVCK
jgi:hypothetical protein